MSNDFDVVDSLNFPDCSGNVLDFCRRGLNNFRLTRSKHDIDRNGDRDGVFDLIGAKHGFKFF